MTFVVNGIEYELLRVSSSEGMALEVWRVDASEGPVAYVSYADRDDSMAFTAFEKDVAFEIIETLVSEARAALTPTAKK
jgi:hypothetical protein